MSKLKTNALASMTLETAVRAQGLGFSFVSDGISGDHGIACRVAMRLAHRL